MAARTLLLTTDIRCLVAGLAALVVGGLMFVVLALLAVALPAVSGAWLALPCAVMLAGITAVGAWLIFGQGAQRFEPEPVLDQEWHWSTAAR